MAIVVTPSTPCLRIGVFGRAEPLSFGPLEILARTSPSLAHAWPRPDIAPEERLIDLFPIGPALLIDSSGASAPAASTLASRIDIALVISGSRGWGALETRRLTDAIAIGAPTVAVIDTAQGVMPSAALLNSLRARGAVCVLAGASPERTLNDLTEAIVRIAPSEHLGALPISAEIASPGDVVVLVVPMELAAPKGRLFVQQVECIRDLLDNEVCCMVSTQMEVRQALRALSQPPSLVVTAAGAFPKVAADIDRAIPMTTYSILLSRAQADLMEFVRGAVAIERLKPGARVLVCESRGSCRGADKVGRSEIPRWLQQRIGSALEFSHCAPSQFPESLEGYDLVIHSDAVSIARRVMLGHILRCRRAGVPITSYGMAIAYTQRLFERALSPFSGALEPYWEQKLAPRGE